MKSDSVPAEVVNAILINSRGRVATALARSKWNVPTQPVTKKIWVALVYCQTQFQITVVTRVTGETQSGEL